MGFGHKVEKALERRQETLIARKLAYRLQDGSVRYQPDLLAHCSAASLTAPASVSRPEASSV
jgi:hypothetical protein